MKTSFGGIFNRLKVLVTGHTGFKGSWLSLWLQQLGSHVIGYSLPPTTDPSNFIVSRVGEGMTDLRGDIRNYEQLQSVIDTYRPEVIFHLAAQPIVLHSFENPKETFDINVGGTVNVLEAARHCPAVKALVMITSDKCYENNEWLWGYRENDALGGHDPYSASKCMAEHAIRSYTQALFAKNPLTHAVVASARAGNVIGGGDFSDKRIVPDCMKALMARQPIRVRNPMSVRPWLNVLDPLSGYLCLAEKLLTKGHSFASAWNFGPLEQHPIDVRALVEMAIKRWGEGDWIHTHPEESKAEMGLLRLNWDKAANHLQWRPTYNWVEAIQQTVDWFKAFNDFHYHNAPIDMREICLSHIHQYTQSAKRLQLPWSHKNNKSAAGELHEIHAHTT